MGGAASRGCWAWAVVVGRDCTLRNYCTHALPPCSQDTPGRRPSSLLTSWLPTVYIQTWREVWGATSRCQVSLQAAWAAAQRRGTHWCLFRCTPRGAAPPPLAAEAAAGRQSRGARSPAGLVAIGVRKVARQNDAVGGIEVQVIQGAAGRQGADGRQAGRQAS